MSTIEEASQSLHIKMKSTSVPVKTLSGGNLQRMVIVRELAHDPGLIVASYLTRGLDVRSAVAVRQALLHSKSNRAAILLISEDLEELLSLSDRILVLFDGRVVGNFVPEAVDLEQIGHLMTGTRTAHES